VVEGVRSTGLTGKAGMKESNALIPVGSIQNRILEIRGIKVIVDADLAEFYGIETKRLNEQVKRNSDRFPEDFMLQLTEEEKEKVVANCDHLSKLKYSSTLPYAFTEHGAIMAASVLNTRRATEVSVFIVRAFVSLRQSMLQYQEIVQRLATLEGIAVDHDEAIGAIIRALKEMAEPKPVPKKRRIGY
jgi:hypothetical protein